LSSSDLANATEEQDVIGTYNALAVDYRFPTQARSPIGSQAQAGVLRKLSPVRKKYVKSETHAERAPIERTGNGAKAPTQPAFG
jgi:hypothetical protein